METVYLSDRHTHTHTHTHTHSHRVMESGEAENERTGAAVPKHRQTVLTLKRVTAMSTFSGTGQTTMPRYGFLIPGCHPWSCGGLTKPFSSVKLGFYFHNLIYIDLKRLEQFH